MFQVMPRRMYFGPSRATSIDLCVRDLVRASRFAPSTRIFAERIEEPFEGFDLSYFPTSVRSRTYSRANYIAKVAREQRPDVIVVQAHLPTAAAIAWRCPDVNVVLHTHNFQKSNYNRRSIPGKIHRALKLGRYRRLAGLIHVSEACARDFAAAWPDITIPQAVIYNGFDFSEWRPAEIREPEILCVGRAIATKGIIDAAQAVAQALPSHPGWRARFILSTVKVEPEYFEAVRSALAPLGERAQIEIQQPFSVVKEAYERAAIALVPSKWVEPFGRTALEAHAGGAALISSGTGGLREASQEHAHYLHDVSPGAIAEAIDTLIASPELREKLGRDGAAWSRTRFSTGQQAARLDEFLGSLPRAARRN
ncbi:MULTISPECIES: glycosyltransferase family 4 protein [Rhodomicrobium]|uniref:glycosyltransferase family 4 protein n=1 Tax=Rhodomicrobium TaxID=1068 RepID=UPI001483594B|nr:MULTISPECIES: glycosyltransferase family 4 protein [Rhodomicrobium]